MRIHYPKIGQYDPCSVFLCFHCFKKTNIYFFFNVSHFHGCIISLVSIHQIQYIPPFAVGSIGKLTMSCYNVCLFRMLMVYHPCCSFVRPKVIKLFFMLNSAEHEIHPSHKC